jgi:hypothetical protein
MSSWNRPVTLPFIVFVGSVVVVAFPPGSTFLRPSRLDLSSLWSDRVFSAGSVAPVASLVGFIVPLLFYRGRGHHDRCRRVSYHRPH